VVPERVGRLRVEKQRQRPRWQRRRDQDVREWLWRGWSGQPHRRKQLCWVHVWQGAPGHLLNVFGDSLHWSRARSYSEGRRQQLLPWTARREQRCGVLRGSCDCESKEDRLSRLGGALWHQQGQESFRRRQSNDQHWHSGGECRWPDRLGDQFRFTTENGEVRLRGHGADHMAAGAVRCRVCCSDRLLELEVGSWHLSGHAASLESVAS